jgi:hypothetical protein
MPISPQNRKLYPPGWPAISLRIRERAGQRCEKCAAPNGKMIARGEGTDAGTYMLEDGAVHDESTGEQRGCARGSEYLVGRFVRIVLTVAHMNHDPQDNSEGNLRALCQLCHNRHDAQHRARNARETRANRKAGRLPGIE